MVSASITTKTVSGRKNETRMPMPNPKMAVPNALHSCCDFITFSSFFPPSWAFSALLYQYMRAYGRLCLKNDFFGIRTDRAGILKPKRNR